MQRLTWWLLFCALAILALVLPAFAVTFEFDWPQTNADGSNLTDLAGARVYTCPAQPCSKTNAVKSGADIPAPALDPPAGAVGGFTLATGSGFAFVTAFDTSGNESGESNVVPFDNVSPAVPTLRKK